MNDLPRSIPAAAELLRSRKASALELAETALMRSHADPHNAWLHLSDEHARAQGHVLTVVVDVRGRDLPVLRDRELPRLEAEGLGAGL